MRRFDWRIISAGIALAALVTLAFVAAPTIVGYLGLFGGWLVPIALAVASNWEAIERWTGRALSLVGWANGAIDRAATSAQIQGVINGARKELEDELGGILAEPAKVRFVKAAGDVAELYDGEVVIAMQNSRHFGENLARATLAYASNALVRPARPYVDPLAMRSIDFSIAKRVLGKTDRAAMDYLINKLWPQASSDDAGFMEMCHQIEVIADDGLLTRVLLAEYLELGRRLYGQFPPSSIHVETREFVSYLYQISSHEPGDELDLEFRRGYLRVGTVLVGDRERVATLGAAPYLRRCLQYARQGASAVYLLGRGARKEVMRRVVDQLAGDGRVIDIGITEYVVRKNGKNVEAACVRVLFDVNARAAFGLTTSTKPRWRRGARAQRRGHPGRGADEPKPGGDPLDSPSRPNASSAA